jgi:hypothetical protein
MHIFAAAKMGIPRAECWTSPFDEKPRSMQRKGTTNYKTEYFTLQLGTWNVHFFLVPTAHLGYLSNIFDHWLALAHNLAVATSKNKSNYLTQDLKFKNQNYAVIWCTPLINTKVTTRRSFIALCCSACTKYLDSILSSI